jgi:hypothetical protein
LRGKRMDPCAEIGKQLLIGVMLFAGFHKIDGLAGNKAEFAVGDGRTDGASDGSKHGEEG